MGLIRSLISFTLLCGVLVLGLTVPIGSHTLFGHCQRIWNTPEAQELAQSVKQASAPLIERAGRGVTAGIAEARR